MDLNDFEGTLILEKLAALELVEQFYEAVDMDDLREVIRLLRSAHVDDQSIAQVIQQIEQG